MPEIKVTYQRLESYQELSAADQALVESALAKNGSGERMCSWRVPRSQTKFRSLSPQAVFLTNFISLWHRVVFRV